MKNQKNPLSRKEDIVVQEMDGEVLIYDLKNNKAFCLNDTSAMVWQMCDGTKSVGEISGELEKKLNQSVNEDLVWLAIDQLKKEKLIANGEELISTLEGMNRRDILKRVGLVSMVALPVIAGVVAPTAAYAASACVPLDGGCMCASSGATGSICPTNPPGACMGTSAGCRCARANSTNTNGNCVP